VRLIPDTQVCYPVFSFKLTYGGDSTGYVRYQWTSSQWLSCSDCAYPLLNVSDTGQYVFSFTQKFWFCDVQQVDSVRVWVRDCNEAVESIPNVFTPNGDGVNDAWLVQWLEAGQVKDVQVEIYDRWGVKVFESEDKFFKWNGKTRSSVSALKGESSIEIECPTGVYYYVLKWESGGKKREVKGYVTLLR